MTYRKRKKLAAVCTSVTGVLLAGVLAGTSVAWSSFDMISQFMNQETYKVVYEDGSEIAPKKYNSDYADMNQLQADETEYAKVVQSEGSVLLQNKNLPLASGGKVTLLGYDSAEANFLVSGGGSGSIDTSKTPSLMAAFEEAGFEVNPVMWDFYENGNGVSSYATDKVNEPAVSLYGSEEIASFDDYHDAAIVFIGRKGSEGSDVFTKTSDDETRSMLNLSQNELDLIDLATEHFDNVVVVLNTMNAMELGELESRNVSVIWVGAGGQQGVGAIPEILNGTRTPSGHLVDTYAYDSFSSPAMQNFGDFTMTYGENNYKYYNYAEGIYVGYKYYETRYADKVYGTGNAGEFDYAAEVQYPFGYGLSYADFSYSNFTVEETNDTFEVSVDVTNDSTEYSGKDAVEIYMQSPYTEYDIENGVEKAGVQLVGFEKSGELAPGETETVTVSVKKSEMRAYDSKNAKTYIVDDGDYYFATGHDAHDALNNILAAQGYTTADGMTADGDTAMTWTYTQDAFDTETYATGVNGTEITNQFDDVDYRTYDETFTYLTRNDWEGTFPQPLGGEEHTMEATDQIADALAAQFPSDDSAEMPTTGASNDLTLADMSGLAYDDANWDLLLDELSADEMMNLVSTGGWNTIAIASIGKPATVDKDGPAGISSTLIGGVGCFGYPIESVLASTWNLELASQMGYFIGEDGLLSGVAGWYAPSMNNHRTPYSGRNFEYYSEDGTLSGFFGAAVVKAAKAKGMYCYVKHFALNDQETNRGLCATWSNEQAVREIYLKPFETTVTDGGANAIMLGMNRVGCTFSGAHRGLCTNVLRNEWGFTGMVITDAAATYSEYMNMQAGMYGGTDLWLCAMNGIFTVDGYASNASVMQALRQSSHRILYTIANSLIMNNVQSGAQIVKVTPLWAKALIGVDILIAVLFAASLIFLILTLRMKKTKADQIQTEEEAYRAEYTFVKSTRADLTALVVEVAGVVVTIIGNVLSPAIAVGANFNLSPVLFVGLAVTVIGLIFAIAVSVMNNKKKIKSTLGTVAILVGVLAVIASIAIIVLTIVLPLFKPTNG